MSKIKEAFLNNIDFSYELGFVNKHRAKKVTKPKAKRLTISKKCGNM